MEGFMTKGTLEITTKIGCKVNCKYCPQKLLINRYQETSGEKPIAMMSFETFKACIDKVPKDIRIDFSGMCEPWLNKECTKMVQYASESGHAIAIFSTFEGATDADISILEKLPSIEQIVLHMPDQEINSNISITKEYLENIKRMLNTKINCQKGISCHGILHDSVRPLVDESIWPINNQMIDRAGNIIAGDVSQHHIKGKLFCSIAGNRLNHNVLLPDGRVLLCCMDYGMQHIIGNLLYCTYDELFVGPTMKSVENAIQMGGTVLCRSCSNAISLECAGDEYLKLLHENEDIWKAKKYLEGQLEGYTAELSNANKTIKEQVDWIQKLEEGKRYLEEQNQNWIIEVENYKKSNQELEKYNVYLTEQNQNWSAEVKNYNKSEQELKTWVSQLEEGKDYLESQNQKLQAELDIYQKNETELRIWIQDLENGKKYLSDKVDEMTNENKKLLQMLDELKLWTEELQLGKDYLENVTQKLERDYSNVKEQCLGYEQIISDAENKLAKLQYKYNRVVNDKLIKKIINLKR